MLQQMRPIEVISSNIELYGSSNTREISQMSTCNTRDSNATSLVPSLIPSFYRLFPAYIIFMNSKKAGGGLGTRL